MVPQFPDKHTQPSLITPQQKLEHNRQHGRLPQSTPPKTVIFCYQSRFLKQVLELNPHRQCDGNLSSLFFLTDHPTVAIGDFGVGAPVAAIRMEDLIAWGVQQFISIGTAGSIHAKLEIGDIVLCDKAVRDEGTSQHYIPPAKYIHAPLRMKTKMAKHLKELEIPHTVGSTWTTDSFYRQTAEEVSHYQKEGVLTVDMEAAALFAVAHCHQVDHASLFTISDTLAGLEWKPHLNDERTFQGLHTLFKVALQAALEQ